MMSTGEISKDEKPATSGSTSSSGDSGKSSNHSNSVLLVPYPKFIFMFPTLIVSLIATIVLYFGGYHSVDPSTQSVPVAMTGLFLIVMLVNMFIIVFDFPRATSLTLLFVISTIGLGLWMLTILQPELLPTFTNWLSGIRPVANTTFFVCISIAMMVMYASIFLSARLNYWELSNNELLHHHGFLSDLKRYPAPNLRVDKEINDVFEFMLLGAGRLILHPSGENRAIVLDNVLFVSKKERELTRVLSTIKVQIKQDSSGSN
jgi:hypothetical protein